MSMYQCRVLLKSPSVRGVVNDTCNCSSDRRTVEIIPGRSRTSGYDMTNDNNNNNNITARRRNNRTVRINNRWSL